VLQLGLDPDVGNVRREVARDRLIKLLHEPPTANTVVQDRRAIQAPCTWRGMRSDSGVTDPVVRRVKLDQVDRANGRKVSSIPGPCLLNVPPRSPAAQGPGAERRGLDTSSAGRLRPLRPTSLPAPGCCGHRAPRATAVSGLSQSISSARAWSRVTRIITSRTSAAKMRSSARVLITLSFCRRWRRELEYPEGPWSSRLAEGPHYGWLLAGAEFDLPMASTA